MDPKCRTFHFWEHHEYVLSDIQHKGDLFIRLRPWNTWYMSHMLLVVRPNAFYASLKSLAQHVVRQQTVSPTQNLQKIVTISMLHHNPPMVYLMFWCKHIICSSCSLHTTSDLWQNLMCMLNDTCTLSRHKSQWRNSLSSIIWRLVSNMNNCDFYLIILTLFLRIVSLLYISSDFLHLQFCFFITHNSELISYNATLYLRCTLSLYLFLYFVFIIISFIFSFVFIQLHNL